MTAIIHFLLICFAHHQLQEPYDELKQWRGPNRDGIYPEETLLKKWPEGGPGMLWSFEGLGEGHGNVGIGTERLFVCGMIDSVGHLFSFDMNGSLVWKKAYGLEWHQNYTGARSTPVVAGDLVYFESGQGVVFCYDGSSGELAWSVDLLSTFKAENIKWGMAESLLIDGNKVICTPGGKVHNVAALDRFTGKTIWTSQGNGQPAAYCSPLIVDHGGTTLIVTITSESIIGLDANTGETYWTIEQRQRNYIHANSPVYFNGQIMCSSSSDRSESDGTVLLQLSDDGKNANVIWRNTEITNLMGGFILSNGFVYGSKYRSSDWYCMSWESGEVQYIEKPFRNGVIIWSDGLFYCYSEGGEMVLVDANPEDFSVISQFDIPLGTNQHWAHPVINEGRLYIRHGNALMVYDISR